MALNDTDRDRDRALDQAYGATAREEPPERLDARILAAAHREAGARPRALGARLRGWLVPISIAAVVVVSVSLVSLVREEGGDYLVHPGIPRPAERSAPDPQPDPERSQPPPSPRRDRAAAGDAEVPDWKPGDRSAGDAASATPPPAVGRTDTPAPGVSAQTRDPEKVRVEGSEAPARPARQAGEASDAADSRTRSRRQEAQPQAPELSRTDPDARGEASTAESAIGPRTAPAPESAAKAKSEPRLQRRLDSGSPELAALVQKYDPLPARDWLGRIEELKKGGRTDLAQGMLDEFKRRYPEYPLPPDLQKAP